MDPQVGPLEVMWGMMRAATVLLSCTILWHVGSS
jgi:hypothetical protein